MLSRIRITFAVILAVLFSGVLLTAQVLTSRVDGTVRDPSGGVLPGVTVTLTNRETGIKKQVVSNDSGNFVFPQVEPGTYRVSAELSGFKTGAVDGVVVEVGQPATVDLELELGEVSEEVVVEASRGQRLLNTVGAEVNTIVNRTQIEDLPLNGRSPTELALLQAGVTGRGEIAREASVNGSRGTFNNLTLDGINNQDNFIRTDAFFGVIPLRESFVQEFNITTSNTEVDAGLGASQTQFVTRSGTNQFHGEAYYYHQNDALNANEFFNNSAGLEKPRLLNHQYGFNGGGPILRNKLFFFAGYEKEKSPATSSVTRNVLSQAARSGQFSYIGTQSGQSETVNLFNLSGLSADPTVGNLISQTPLPNDFSSNAGDGVNTLGFRFNAPNSSDQDWLVFRVDYDINEHHEVSGTFHQFRFDLPLEAGIGSPFPGLPGAGQSSTRRLGSYSWRSSYTRLVNEARFGFQWAPVDFFTSETFTPGYQLDLGTDLISNPVQNFQPQGRNSPVWEFADSASWIAGNHVIKFGGNARWIKVDQYNDAGILPLYTLGFNTSNANPLTAGLFPGGISSNDLTNASEILAVLAGSVDQGSQVFNVTSPDSGFVDGASQTTVLKQNFFSFYGGDTWRVTPRLTLDYGLRWEYHGVPYEANGLALLPRGGVEAVLDPNAVVDFAGPNGARPFFNQDRNNFAPNVGLAWRLRNKTVFRAGYTINYVIDNNMTVVLNALRGNAGLSQMVTLTGLAGTVTGGGLAPIQTPEFKVPRTARDQILADPQAALFTIDPNLKVPYVQQWNISLQHEILPDTVIEARYIGNHGVQLGRATDLNQVMFPQEFVDDFRRAQRNLAANGDPTVGETLTFIPNLGLGGFLQDPGVQTWIANGEIGNYVGGFLAPFRNFFFAGEGGEAFGSTVPISLFYRNPNIFVGDVVGNGSFSKYNAFQFEVRRRFNSGFAGQFNYTYGKVLTNFSGTQTGFRGFFDNAQQSLEVMRPDFDITHTLNGNFVWQVPVGHGRRYLAGMNSIVEGILGGWNLSGIVRVRSGETVNIISGRGTINRGGSRAQTNTVDLTGLTISQLQDRTGLFHDDKGHVLLFDPSLIGADGRASSQFFQNPGLLEAGTLGLASVSGPWYSTLDLGVRKAFNLPFTEDSKLEFRWDFFNILNRTNFNISTTPGSSPSLDTLGIYNRFNINATDFGVISDTFSARQMQVGMKISF